MEEVGRRRRRFAVGRFASDHLYPTGRRRGETFNVVTRRRAGRDAWRRWLVHQSVAVLIACAPDSFYPTGDDVETLTWRHNMLYVE